MRSLETKTPVSPEDRDAASRMVVATLASALATGIRTGAVDMKVVEPYLETMAEAGRPAGLHPRLSDLASEWGREQVSDVDVEKDMRALARELSPMSTARGPSAPEVAVASTMSKAGAER